MIANVISLFNVVFPVLASFLLPIMYKRTESAIRIQRNRMLMLEEGVKSLLRNSIIDMYNKYTERGYMPIYAKEALRRTYDAYHGLGGNDVATELYQKMLDMEETIK